MTSRRIVVTGAGGMIGRAVVRRLVEEGDEVVAVLRPGTEWPAFPAAVSVVEHDLGAGGGLPPGAGAFDGLIHLAQGSGWHDFPARAGDVAAVNIAGTIALASASAAAGAKTFVFASSGGIYGPARSPIVETSPLRPAAELGFYLSTKVAAEQLLAYFQSHLCVHLLRPFFVYGLQQRQDFLIPRLINSVRKGLPIRVAGGRGPRLNPLWVDDAARCFVAALSVATPLISNIAGQETVSLKDVADTIGEIVDRQPVFDMVDAQPEDYVADTGVMRKTFGASEMALSDGLRRICGADPTWERE